MDKKKKALKTKEPAEYKLPPKKTLLKAAEEKGVTLPKEYIHHPHMIERFSILTDKLDQQGLNAGERKEILDLIQIKRHRLDKQLERTQEMNKASSEATRAMSEAEQMKIGIQLKILKETELRVRYDQAAMVCKQAKMQGNEKVHMDALNKMDEILKKLKTLQKEKAGLQLE